MPALRNELRKPVMLRIPVDLIPCADRTAERLGLSRSDFIVMCTAERLDRMEAEHD